jgi:hypothetical protein
MESSGASVGDQEARERLRTEPYQDWKRYHGLVCDAWPSAAEASSGLHRELMWKLADAGRDLWLRDEVDPGFGAHVLGRLATLDVRDKVVRLWIVAGGAMRDAGRDYNVDLHPKPDDDLVRSALKTLHLALLDDLSISATHEEEMRRYARTVERFEREDVMTLTRWPYEQGNEDEKRLQRHLGAFLARRGLDVLLEVQIGAGRADLALPTELVVECKVIRKEAASEVRKQVRDAVRQAVTYAHDHQVLFAFAVVFVTVPVQVDVVNQVVLERVTIHIVLVHVASPAGHNGPTVRIDEAWLTSGPEAAS